MNVSIPISGLAETERALNLHPSAVGRLRFQTCTLNRYRLRPLIPTMTSITLPPHRPWHALLAPLPADAAPVRQPVVSPGFTPPEGSEIAGWQQLVLHLSAGAAGLRTVLVVLDADGAMLSASDAVLYRTPVSNDSTESHGPVPGTLVQLSIGGRFEEDGSFHGTRWHSVALQRDGQEPEWESTPSQPSLDDVDGLRSVVAELVSRAGETPP